MTKEPSCLNEIPKFYHEIYPQLEALVKLRDVQRLVCRRIIKIENKTRKLDILSDVHREWSAVITELMVLFNITDAMLEEERKHGKHNTGKL